MQKHQNFEHLGSSLNIAYLNIDELKPYKDNARTHSPKQIKQVAKSIEAFGFTNPILVDAHHNVIAGHARIEAAKLTKMQKVPVIRLDYLTEAQKRAYILADNKLAENAGWDMDILKQEMEFLSSLEIDFDLTLTGFELAEIDTLMFHEKVEAEPNIPPLSIFTNSQPGDLWHLGPHRLLCADARAPSSYKALMAGAQARLIFTDPPYNVPIAGHVCGKGTIKHDEFKMASGEMSSDEFIVFLRSVLENLRSCSIDGSLHYICMDWRHMRELLEAGEIYEELKNLCVWNKTNGGMGSLYRSKHELVFVYKHGSSPHINNIELGKNGRYRTNVWDYAGANTFQGTKDLSMHPTVKPIAMIKDVILDCSHPGEIVLDVFGGSGSTLLAAEQCNRIAYIMEIDPKYVDLIIRRYQQQSGKDALHADGSTFKAKSGERNGQR